MNTQFSNQNQALVDGLGRNLAARLSDSTDQLPHEISERLKAARMFALSKRKVVQLQTASDLAISGNTAALHLGQTEHLSLWNKVASWVPLIALVFGMITIAVLQDEMNAGEVADVDTELLADDLPPDAYTEPGFLPYLRASRNND